MDANLVHKVEAVKSALRTAYTDKLTGVNNMNAYLAYIERYENAPVESNLWYIKVDVNGLKMINDTIGHSAGDEVITATAKCCAKAIGDSGKVYRVGGDEFMAFVYANQDEYKKIEADIINEMESWKGEFVDKLAFSIGSVNAEELNSTSLKELSEEADRRMYQAKKAFYETHKEYDARAKQRS